MGYERPDDWEPPKISLEEIEYFDDEEVTLEEAREMRRELQHAMDQLDELIDKNHRHY
jgi:ribosome biogenesis SPOUT family RNA methylase Rps3